MMQRLGVPFLAAAAFGLLAASAQAQPSPWPDPQGGPGPGTPPPGRQERMARELGLSEAQQEKMREIMDERRAQREALFEKISANREALHRLLESGSADANAVGELVLAGRRLHEEGRTLREAEQKAIRSILTPEQQKKFDSIQEKRRERMPGRRPEGWQGPPPGDPGTSRTRPPLGTSRPGQPQL